MKKIQDAIFYFFSDKFLGASPRIKVTLLWMIFLAVIPQVGGFVAMDLFLMASIFLIYTTAWDLLSGYTGQESFGHSLFIGLSAYFTGFLAFRFANLGIMDIHTPFVVNLLIGAGIAALFGLIIGLPSLKLKGPFLALATLSSAALAHELIMPLSKYTNGEEGMDGLPTMPKISIYYIAVIIMFICVGISYFISRSKYGTLLKAIREDDAAAKAVGINTTKFKVGTFVISAAICGIAGSLHAYTTGVVSPMLADTGLSLEIITFAVVGGMGTIVGPIGGVYFLWILGYFLNSIAPEFKTIVFMALMVIIMLLMPKGIWAHILDKITASFKNWKKARGE